MIGRVSYDLAKLVLKVALQLWPLWLFWFSWQAASALWRDLLVLQPDPAASSYLLLYRAWPSAALLGPILLMALGVVAHRLQFAGRTIAIAGILGVLCATALTAWPEWLRLSPYFGKASPLSILRAMDGGIVVASAFGLVAAAVAIEVLRGSSLGRSRTDLQRAPSDNHGHADWLSVKEARKLFPGPGPGPVPSTAASWSAKPIASTWTASPVEPSIQTTAGPGDKAARLRCSSIPAGRVPPTRS